MRRILITGAHGFLGKHVCREFAWAGYVTQGYRMNAVDPIPGVVFQPTRKECNLLDIMSLGQYCIRNDITDVIHLAALCGGIGLNRDRPAELIHDNLQMGVNILRAAAELNFGKTVLLGTVCMYPKFTEVPFREDSLWDGYPEETNAPYGIAKKTLSVMGNAYREQYGLSVITLVPVNLAGEHDHFDESKSHVIPALVKKFVQAREQGEPSVTLWGDGSASPEFLYAGDCAKGIRLAFERYDSPEPVNLGTGHEITIRDLAFQIADKVGYMGEIEWDTSKPNGQPRRCLDITRAAEQFGFAAETDIDTILDKTIEDFQARREEWAEATEPSSQE